jgi:hypothetical protein
LTPEKRLSRGRAAVPGSAVSGQKTRQQAHQPLDEPLINPKMVADVSLAGLSLMSAMSVDPQRPPGMGDTQQDSQGEAGGHDQPEQSEAQPGLSEGKRERDADKGRSYGDKQAGSDRKYPGLRQRT